MTDDVGQDMGDGLAAGMRDMLADVVREAEAIASRAVTTVAPYGSRPDRVLFWFSYHFGRPSGMRRQLLASRRLRRRARLFDAYITFGDWLMDRWFPKRDGG